MAEAIRQTVITRVQKSTAGRGVGFHRIISRSCERDNYDDLIRPTKLPSIARPSEYPSDDFIGICVKTAAMAQQDSLRLP